MFYALSMEKNKEFLENNVNLFVALAPVTKDD
jgi:hypothetical protein